MNIKYIAKVLALAAHKQPLAQRVAWPLQEDDTQSHPYLKHPYLNKHLQTHQRANKTTVKFQNTENSRSHREDSILPQTTNKWATGLAARELKFYSQENANPFHWVTLLTFRVGELKSLHTLAGKWARLGTKFSNFCL